MRRFTTACIDNVTKMEMVLSECSFNEACMFLEKENKDNRFGNFVSAKGKLTKTEIIYEKANFLYDEERGYLLREVI